MRRITLFYLLSLFFYGCEKSDDQKPIGDVHQLCLNKLTDIIVYDIYSPPVASRIYAYCNLAYFEGIRYSDPTATSLTDQLKGFDRSLAIGKVAESDFEWVAASAFLQVAHGLVFSKDSLVKTQLSIDEYYKAKNHSTVQVKSMQLAQRIAANILKRAANDRYKETRGMPRYSVLKETGKWEQTPPDYSDAVEPHWRLIAPLLLDSASQFKPPPPPPFDLQPTSRYFQELTEVHQMSQARNPVYDSIAYYWDDNPFVTGHQGHLMFATKKITPGGHWMGITSQLCAQRNLSSVEKARALALVSAAIFDGFISCWDEKFSSRTVRPVTVIRQLKEATWMPFLQTPPFPEYTSGHSVISSSAATVLATLVGDSISFTDTSELAYLGMKRSFRSVSQAADEAGISRLYGGIHFRSAIEQGKWQGRQVGGLYVQLVSNK